MGICGEQCPEVSRAVEQGISLESLGARVVSACYGQELNCANNGPDAQNGRCRLDPGIRKVLRAVVDVATNPIEVPTMSAT